MENKIIERITNYDNTSFSDLSRHVEGFDGKFSLTDPNNKGVVFGIIFLKKPQKLF